MKKTETRDDVITKVMVAKSQGESDIEVSREAIELFTGAGYLKDYVSINGVKVHVYGTKEATEAAEKRTVIELENRAE